MPPLGVGSVSADCCVTRLQHSGHPYGITSEPVTAELLQESLASRCLLSLSDCSAARSAISATLSREGTHTCQMAKRSFVKTTAFRRETNLQTVDEDKKALHLALRCISFGILFFTVLGNTKRNVEFGRINDRTAEVLGQSKTWTSNSTLCILVEVQWFLVLERLQILRFKDTSVSAQERCRTWSLSDHLTHKRTPFRLKA